MPVSEPSAGAAWGTWGNGVTTIVNSVETADARLDALESGVAAGVNTVTAANATMTVAGTSTDPTVAVGTIAESQVTNLVTDLAAKLVKASNLSDLTDASAARTNLGLAPIAASGSATSLTTGTVATARLGSGTANATRFLRGDQTWAPGAGSNFTDIETLGAVGDDATDNTSALQTAAASGGLIYVPDGIFRYNGTLTCTSDTVFFGAGMNRSVLRQMSTTSHGLTCSAVRRFAVRDLWLRGNGGTVDGINMVRGANANVPYVNLQNVQVSGFGQDGVSIENAIVSELSVVNSVSNGRYGFNLYGTGGSGTSVHLNACYGNANTTAGHRLSNMAYCSLTACAADSNPTGYLIDGCQAITLTGCGAEANTTSSFTINGGSGNTLISPRTYDHRGAAITLSGSAAATTIIGGHDASPNVAATSFATVGAGSKATMIGCTNTTANSLLGTVTILDQSGNLLTPGNLAGHTSPGGHGLLAWSYDMVTATSGTVVTNGTVNLVKIYIPSDDTVTRIIWAVSAAGVTPTAGQSYVGLYSSAGTRLQTTGVDADISSIGVKTTTISSQAVTAGSYVWVGMVFNAATPPTIARSVGGTVAAELSNFGLGAGAYRFAVNGTVQTSLPSSITPGSNLQGTSFWAALAR